MSGVPVVEVRDLGKHFGFRRRSGGPAGTVRAVHQVSFEVYAGETLGLVGESGSGKSTTARMVAGLLEASEGTIRLFGREITGSHGRENLRAVRRKMQIVFQDPNGSLNPRMRVGDLIAEPIDISESPGRRERAGRVAELLEMVGLPASCAERYPHEFSGGQKQRIGIARALALRPELILCDEPVSALDVSMQAQVVNLLLDLQERFELSYLFIAHDLAVVRSISTRVAVMYLGSIVEVAPRRSLYEMPMHPYTRALLEAVPRPIPGKRTRPALRGELAVGSIEGGCAFRSRCPKAFDRCRTQVPILMEIESGHFSACHLHHS